jgi:ankyrin repeat protein
MPRDQWKRAATDNGGGRATSRDEEAAAGANKGGKKNKRGRGTTSSTVLFKLIRSQDWPECLNRCYSHPEDTNHIECGNSVLHYALHNRPEINDDDASPNLKEAAFLQLIECLLETNPALLSSVDDLGYTPLHVVCSKNPSALLVQMILKYCPPTDAHFLQQMLSVPLEVAEKILEFVPNPAVTKDTHGKTPLFLACQRSKKRKNERLNCEVVKLLVEYAPEAVDIKDNTFRTPLDIVRHQKNSEEIVDLLSRR